MKVNKKYLIGFAIGAAASWALITKPWISPAKFAIPVIVSSQSNPKQLIKTRAVHLPLGYDTPGSLVTNDESDWYYVDLDRAGRLKLSLSNLPHKYELYIFNQQGDVVAAGIREGYLETASFAKIDAPGRYYIEVVNDSKEASNQPYDIRVDALPFLGE